MLLVSLRRDHLPLTVLLILLPATNVATAVRIPQCALAVLLSEFPLTFIDAAISEPADAETRFFAVFEVADVKISVFLIDKVALQIHALLKQALEGSVLLNIPSKAMWLVVLVIARVLGVTVVIFAKSLSLLGSFEPVVKFVN